MSYFSPTPWLLPNGANLWFADAVPTLSTDGKFNAGDYLWITATSAGISGLYKCVTGGSPGTWQHDNARKFTAVSGAYTALITDDVIVQSSAAAVTLPAAASVPNKVYTVKANNASGATVVIAASGTIDTASHTATLGAAYSSVSLQSDGTTWWAISSFSTVNMS